MRKIYGIILNSGRFFDIVIKEFTELTSHRRNGGRVNSTTSPFKSMKRMKKRNSIIISLK